MEIRIMLLEMEGLHGSFEVRKIVTNMLIGSTERSLCGMVEMVNMP